MDPAFKMDTAKLDAFVTLVAEEAARNRAQIASEERPQVIKVKGLSRVPSYPVIRDIEQNREIARTMQMEIETLAFNLEREHIVLAFTGTSGMFFASEVSRDSEFHYHFVQVRKEGEPSHRLNREDSDGIPYWDRENILVVFVDDFIETGRTLLFVAEHARKKFIGGLDAVAVSGATSRKIVREAGADYLIGW